MALLTLSTSTASIRPTTFLRTNPVRVCTCRASPHQQAERGSPLVIRRDVLRLAAAGLVAANTLSASPVLADTFNAAKNAREARKEALLAAARAKATGGEIPDIPDYVPINSLDISAGSTPKAAAAPKSVAEKKTAAPQEKKDAPKKKSEDPVASSKKLSPNERDAQKAEILAAVRAKALAQSGASAPAE